MESGHPPVQHAVWGHSLRVGPGDSGAGVDLAGGSLPGGEVSSEWVPEEEGVREAVTGAGEGAPLATGARQRQR